jgi:hypothetical protein
VFKLDPVEGKLVAVPSLLTGFTVDENGFPSNFAGTDVGMGRPALRASYPVNPY